MLIRRRTRRPGSYETCLHSCTPHPTAWCFGGPLPGSTPRTYNAKTCHDPHRTLKRAKRLCPVLMVHTCDKLAIQPDGSSTKTRPPCDSTYRIFRHICECIAFLSDHPALCDRSVLLPRHTTAKLRNLPRLSNAPASTQPREERDTAPDRQRSRSNGRDSAVDCGAEAALATGEPPRYERRACRARRRRRPP